MARVLVVDDEKGIRLTFREFLKTNGHEVLVAEDFAEAEKLFHARNLDVVVTDIVLPRVSGLTLLKEVQRVQPGVQVIIITGEPTVETAIQAVRSGAFDYIAKPVSGTEICRIVAQAARIKAQNDENARLWEDIQRSREHLESLVREKDEALKETEEGYNVLMESAGDSISIVDDDGRFLFMNGIATMNLDLDPGGYHGKTMWDFFPPAIADRQVSSIRHCIRNGRGRVVENLSVVNGEPCWYRTCIQPLRNAEGEIVKALVIASDIHERILAEEALRESETRYRTVVENIGEGICTVDADERVIFANRAAAEIFGVTPETLPGRSLSDFFDMDQFSIIQDETVRRKAGERNTYEVSMRRPNGRYRDLMVTSTPQFDTDGRYTGAFGVFRDITEFRRTQAAIRESEEKYRNLVELSADGVCIIREGRLVFVNPILSRMLKIPQAELLNTYFSDHIHPDFRQSLQNLYRQHMKGERDLGIVEAQLIRSDGEPVLVELNGSVIEYGGIPAEMLAIRDITRHREVERAYREAVERYKLVAENVEDVTWVLDLDFNTTFVSPAITRQTGLTMEEAVRQPIIDQVTPESAQRAVEMIREELQWEKAHAHESPPRTQTLEIERYTKDGGTIWLEIRANLVRDERGRPFCVMGISRNIDDRKRVEAEKKQLHAELLQARKLEAVGRLAGGIAHDFNNLLTGISGNVSLAMMEEGPDPYIRELLSDIQRASDQAASLTRQLLAFSRKQKPDPKTLDLNELLRRTIAVLERSLPDRIRVRLHPTNDLWAVRADPAQMEQVFANLATNARDAITENGRLEIETENITIDDVFSRLHVDLSPGDYVRVRVRDDGAGIDRRTRSSIFEPYFSTKPKGKGSGLGLSIAYGIVKEHRGAIHISSKEGEGTLAEVYLPRHKTRTDDPLDRRVKGLPSGHERILLVEDEPVVRHMNEKILKRLGYRVLSAGNGPEALGLMKANSTPVELLLTDIFMPHMSGWELAELLRKGHPFLKVLYTSGYPKELVATLGNLNKDMHFIGKPYTPQAFARKIREVLGESHPA